MIQLRCLRETGLNTLAQLVTVSVGPDSSILRHKNCLKVWQRDPSAQVTFAISLEVELELRKGHRKRTPSGRVACHTLS